MSTRKRPLEARSRGHSPPEKRSRPLERPASIQERSSVTGLAATVPTELASRSKKVLRVDQYRSNTIRDTTDKTLSNGVSRPVSDTTSGNGRRGSTSVQVAPPVPRMLPAVGKKSPHTVASLQSLKIRRKAIGDYARPLNRTLDSSSTTAPASSGLQAQIKAQALEIIHLKKQLDTLLVKTNKQGDVLPRLEAMEKSNLTSELKPLSDKIDKLEAAASKSAKEHEAVVSAVKRVNSTVETVPDIKQDIVSLKSWQTTQSNAITENQLKDVETRLSKRMDDDRKDLAFLSSGVRISLDFKATTKAKIKEMESSNVRTYNKTTALEKRFSQLHDDCRKVLGQVQSFQSELSRLTNDQKRLSTSRAELATRINVLEKDNPNLKDTSKRLENFDVDIKQLRQGAEQISTLMTRISALEKAHKDNTTSTNTDKRLDRLDVDIKQLRQDAEQNNGLMLKITEVEKGTKRTSENHEKFTQDLEELRSRVSSLDLLPAKIKEMQPLFQKSKTFEARLSGVEAHASSRSDGEVQVPRLPAHPDSAMLEQMQSDINAMKEDVASLGTDLEATEQNVHQHSVVIDGLNEDLPALFTRKFDPFKQKVEPQLEVMMGDIKDMKSRLGSKAEISVMAQQLDRFTLAVQSLQGQFDNITTDALYQQMVHWFVQHYPNAQGLLQQLSTTQQAVDRLEGAMTQLSWLHSRSQDLTTLLNAAPRLQTLLQTAPELQRLADLAKAAMDNAREASAKAEQQDVRIQNIQNAVAGLHTSVSNFNASTTPSTKSDALKSLEQDYKNLRDRVEEGFVDERRARNEMRTAAGKDHDQRVKVDQSTQARLDQLRKDVDRVNETFIEPNKDLLNVLATIVVFLGVVQQNIESINQNLKIKLNLKWGEDSIANLLERVETHENSGNSVDKGNDKQ